MVQIAMSPNTFVFTTTPPYSKEKPHYQFWFLSRALHRAYRQRSNSALQCRLWVISGQTVTGQNPSLSALAQKRTNAGAVRLSAKCHVWTTPAVQGKNLAFQRSVRVQPCIRPLNAAVVAAGPDVIRRSGRKQKHALKYRVALNGFSRSTVSTVSHQCRHHPCSS